MKKDIIKRDSHETNQFVRLTTTTFFDERLTDSGCRLLIAILNNAEDWKVNVTYYGNKFGWSSGKTTSAKKNLIECGYLTEQVEMTSKGKIYHYTIFESFTNEGKSLHLISKDWKPSIENQTLETNDWEPHANNINTDNIESDKMNQEKNKEIKISDSVSVSTQSQELTESIKIEERNTNINTPLQLKEFFFSYGERPCEEKILAYVEKQGYSREVGREIFLELHNKDFKNQKGTPIKGIEKYIDSMLSDRSKHSHHTSIDSFLEAIKPVNEWFINKSIANNEDLSIYRQTSLLDAKEAAREYWNSISKDKDEYILYMKSFIEQNGWKSMANFKAYIFKHQQRQTQNTGTNYV
ncbi:MAG: hypothetical protein J0G96_13520 [Flavobacteriia bacterium]|nr:hypothetical protein [Flavobacteriia bacterium]OJX39610.1 MAG: hypothetical protein BGO87_11770 [Flavobacteriia bacterium 40-80]